VKTCLFIGSKFSTKKIEDKPLKNAEKKLKEKNAAFKNIKPSKKESLKLKR